LDQNCRLTQNEISDKEKNIKEKECIENNDEVTKQKLKSNEKLKTVE